MVAEDTFRPPWYVSRALHKQSGITDDGVPRYHRNTMSEFMGLLGGVYDGKEGGGFSVSTINLCNVWNRTQMINKMLTDIDWNSQVELVCTPQ